MKDTAKHIILRRLAEIGRPVPVHELGLVGVSENSAASRLSELAASGLVLGKYQDGKRFKFWSLAPVAEHRVAA